MEEWQTHMPLLYRSSKKHRLGKAEFNEGLESSLKLRVTEGFFEQGVHKGPIFRKVGSSEDKTLRRAPLSDLLCLPMSNYTNYINYAVQCMRPCMHPTALNRDVYDLLSWPVLSSLFAMHIARLMHENAHDRS